MNKRAHIRHHVAMPARLILGEEPGRICQVKDFCLGGMLLSLPESGLPTPENLQIDTSVRLALDVQGLRGMRRVILPARIRRQTGSALGVAFDHPDSKDLLAVQHHVRVLLQKEPCGAPCPDPQPLPTSSARNARSASAVSAPAPGVSRKHSLYYTAWRLAQYHHVSGWCGDEPVSVPPACREALARALLPFQREGLAGQALPAVVKQVMQVARLSHGPALQAQAELVQSVVEALAANPSLDERLRNAMVNAQVPILRLLLAHEVILDGAAQPLTRLLDLVVALGLRGRPGEGLAVLRTLSTKESITINELNNLSKYLNEVMQRVEARSQHAADILDETASAVVSALDMTIERLYCELSHAARHDPVTGLLTWTELKRRLDRESAFRGTLVWLEPGHDPHAPVSRQGNELVRYIGSVLKDMFHNRLVARADERAFIVWLATTGLAAGQTAMEAFRRRLNTTRAGQDANIKLSIGLAERQPLQTADSLMRDTKSACAVAATHGGGQQVAALPDSRSDDPTTAFGTDAEARVILQTRHAEPRDPTGRPACIVEARLAGAGGRAVSPRGFAGSLLHQSQMPALDRRMITSLLRWLHRNPRVSARYDLFLLRLSRLSLRDSGLPEFLNEQFRRYSVAPDHVCLEFAEVDVAEDPESARRRMQALKETGCRLALGGFGMAEIPLDKLRALPVDILAPDEALVASMHEASPGIPALIQGLVAVANLIERRVLVSRVPDADANRQLKVIGVDWVERARRAGETQPGELALRGESTETSC